MSEHEKKYPWTVDPSHAMDIRVEGEGNAGRKPVTVVERLQETVERSGQCEALKVKREKDKWSSWSWKQFQEEVTNVGKSYIKLGAPMHGTIGVLGFNSPEWLFADVGAIYAGCAPFGIYTTNGPEACHFVLEDSRACICVVENDTQLQKVLEVRDRLPHLKAIVQYLGKVKGSPENVYDWETFMNMGKDVTDAQVRERTDALKPGHLGTIIYTSGTTGNPKATMISHDALTWVARVVTNKFQMTEKDHIVSFLPLSHIAAQMVDLHAPMACGGTVWFAQPDALKGTLAKTLQEVRPTMFLGVPRVWEKIAEKMQAIGAQTKGVKKMIGGWAKKKGIKGNMNKQAGKGKPSGWWLADKLVFSKVKGALGLDRCRMAFTGAAPINYATLMYFLSLDIPIYEIYGLSESTALCSISMVEEYRTGSTGKALEGTDLKIDNPDNDGNGEILIRGRNLFMGYLNLPDKSAGEFDNDGYLHTGDIGKLDADGFLTITGRIKELIITAGGENVPPLQLEAAVKANIPVISNAMVIGDKRRFLICLLTLKCEFDDDGIPLDKLTPPVLKEFHDNGITATTVKEAIEDKKVRDLIEAGIEAVNKEATSNAQTIRKWALLPVDFSVAGNELGPTMKLKRRVVNKLYKDLVEELYL